MICLYEGCLTVPSKKFNLDFMPFYTQILFLVLVNLKYVYHYQIYLVDFYLISYPLSQNSYLVARFEIKLTLLTLAQ